MLNKNSVKRYVHNANKTKKKAKYDISKVNIPKIFSMVVTAFMLFVFVFQGITTAFHLSLVDTYVPRNYYLPREEIYNQRAELESMSGENLLLFGDGQDTFTQWSYYYARKNNIWLADFSMSAKGRSESKKMSAFDYSSMPEDVNLIWIEGAGTYCFLTNPDLSNEIGALILNTKNQLAISPHGLASPLENITLVSYSKDAYSGNLIVTLRGDEGDDVAKTFPVLLNKGWNRHEMSWDTPLLPFDWVLEINEKEPAEL